MASIEWLNSRPYYLDSSSTPYHFLWGGVWCLFDEQDFDNFGTGILNLGIHVSLEIDLKLEGDEWPVYSGLSEAYFLNRFRIDQKGNVQDPDPDTEAYRYSTDDGRIGIPFQLFNLNTLKTYTQLADLSFRERSKLMRAAPQVSGSLSLYFDSVVLDDQPTTDPSGTEIKNAFLLQETQHPQWQVFSRAPDRHLQAEEWFHEQFRMNVKWEAGIDFGLSVNWDTDAELPVGPNRHGRNMEFPGDKYYA